MMDRMDQLIRLKATGTPERLASRLGISLTVLKDYILFMRKLLKAPIRYNKYDQSYYYEFLPDYHLGFEKDRSCTTHR